MTQNTITISLIIIAIYGFGALFFLLKARKLIKEVTKELNTHAVCSNGYWVTNQQKKIDSFHIMGFIFCLGMIFHSALLIYNYFII
jgi:hypothetical protein